MKTIEECQTAAEKGEAWAQADLGYRHWLGCDVKKDEKIGVEWLRKAAEQGNRDAQNDLGYMYQQGRGVEKDEKVSAGWYEKSAKQGCAPAQYNLGLMYVYGKGIEKDEKKGIEWFRKAAEQGHGRAQYSLGIIYYYGQGEEVESNVAEKLFKKINPGHLAAQQNFKVGELLEKPELIVADEKGNKEKIQRMYKESYRYFRQAAICGHVKAKETLIRAALADTDISMSQNERYAEKIKEWPATFEEFYAQVEELVASEKNVEGGHSNVCRI